METHPKGHIFYSATNKPGNEEAYPIPMQPGDALIFDGDLLHYTSVQGSLLSFFFFLKSFFLLHLNLQSCISVLP